MINRYETVVPASGTVEFIEFAMKSGFPSAVETCPHSVAHDEDWRSGDIGKINPPLRS
jgi:dihydroorotase-like cyclic amidohydrolase